MTSSHSNGKKTQVKDNPFDTAWDFERPKVWTAVNDEEVKNAKAGKKIEIASKVVAIQQQQVEKMVDHNALISFS